VWDNAGTLGYVKSMSGGSFTAVTMFTKALGDDYILNEQPLTGGFPGSPSNTVKINGDITQAAIGSEPGIASPGNVPKNRLVIWNMQIGAGEGDRQITLGVAFGSKTAAYATRVRILFQIKAGDHIAIDSTGKISSTYGIAAENEPGLVKSTEGKGDGSKDGYVHVDGEGLMTVIGWEKQEAAVKALKGAMTYIGVTSADSAIVDAQLQGTDFKSSPILTELVKEYQRVTLKITPDGNPKRGYCAITNDNKAYVHNDDGTWVDIGNCEVVNADNTRYGLVKGVPEGERARGDVYIANDDDDNEDNNHMKVHLDGLENIIVEPHGHTFS
jgi:hypothetical protein